MDKGRKMIRRMEKMTKEDREWGRRKVTREREEEDMGERWEKVIIIKEKKWNKIRQQKKRWTTKESVRWEYWKSQEKKNDKKKKKKITIKKFQFSNSKSMKKKMIKKIKLIRNINNFTLYNEICDK